VSQHRIVIVGSGFAGLGMAIGLKRAGIEDFVVLERADDLGGTWRDNTYPGCACDIPSNLYSFSFAPNPHWTRFFAGQPEILAYLRECAERYGISPHLRYGHELLEARWDSPSDRWHLDTSRGAMTAQVLITGTGPLSEPARPALPGLDSFAGTVFHSADWDHNHDLTGRRVAVVGTGASSIQFVPRIAPRVEQLYVFQRTAPWLVPRPDRAVTPTEARLFRVVPGAQAMRRAASYSIRELTGLGLRGNPRLLARMSKLAAGHLAGQVSDPELRARLTPNYTIGCKRILISSDFYPALQRGNVELVTSPIARVRPGAVVTTDEAERPVDTLILATGFHVADQPAGRRLRGRDGRLMSEVWEDSAQAYLGTAVAGFPNLFLLVGPNTGLGHNSIVYMIESQITYVMAGLRAMARAGVSVVDLRPEVQDAYNRRVQADMAGTVWTAGGCASWYLDSAGRNTTLWPGSTWAFRRQTRRFRLADYITAAPAPAVERGGISVS
jgi:cation diffusion facilitator CzcD-associated flavoprotein CzcO